MNLYKINKADNVSVVLDPDGEIPFGHKVAVCDIKEGQNIIKYGEPIGHATKDIRKGEQVHTHNLKTNLSGVLEYSYDDADVLAYTPQQSDLTFKGYLRKDATAGTRNEIWIIPTVGCVNKTAEILAKDAEFDGVDAVCALTHNMGCSQLEADLKRTQLLLKGLINNPNAGAVLVLSLGCENNNLDAFLPILGDYDHERVRFLVTQDVSDELAAGRQILRELADYAARFKRSDVSISKLSIGFKCGGSDAFSGITANPLCGRLCDKLTSFGASAILTEVPEMFGAETLLMKRALSREIFEKVVKLINDFKAYYTRYDQVIYENPSPGNKLGGITTLEEKSLGCTQKGGLATVTDVLNWGEPLKEAGLSLLIGPGNDQVSCTNLTASGVNLICFTTGRGNPFGAPVPTVKIATNALLSSKKSHWIDFDASQAIDSDKQDLTDGAFLDYIISVASGETFTKNELNGYREISIFRDGVIL